MPYLSASAVVIHYEEALYQVDEQVKVKGKDLLPLLVHKVNSSQGHLVTVKSIFRKNSHTVVPFFAVLRENSCRVVRLFSPSYTKVQENVYVVDVFIFSDEMMAGIHFIKPRRRRACRLVQTIWAITYKHHRTQHHYTMIELLH